MHSHSTSQVIQSEGVPFKQNRRQARKLIVLAADTCKERCAKVLAMPASLLRTSALGQELQTTDPHWPNSWPTRARVLPIPVITSKEASIISADDLQKAIGAAGSGRAFAYNRALVAAVTGATGSALDIFSVPATPAAWVRMAEYEVAVDAGDPNPVLGEQG